MQASELRGKFEHAANEETGMYADLPSRCQMRQVLNQVTEQSVSYSVERSDTPEDFGRLLRESISFVEEMQRVLNPLTMRDHLPLIVDQYKERLPDYEKSVPANSWIWRHLSARFAFSTGEKGGYYWPVNVDEVAEICHEYLQKRWLHCQLIDRLLVDALIYQEALSFGEQVKPALLGGGFTGGVLASVNPNFLKAQNKKMFKDGMWGILVMLLGVFIGLGAADSHGWWVGILAGYGFWVLFKISWYVGNLERIGEVRRIAGLLEDLHGASDMMQKYPLSPRYVRERLNASADKGVIWPVGVFPILDNAINRSAAEWR